jgi:hypothetical protein
LYQLNIQVRIWKKTQISDPFFVSEQQLRCAKNSKYFKQHRSPVLTTPVENLPPVSMRAMAVNFATVNDTGGKKWEQY